MLNIKGRETVPPLEIATLDGGTWRLSDSRPQNFTLIVFYRGLHCPQCKRYLAELQSKLDDLDQLGVATIAVSADSKDRAAESRREWALDRLTIGYSLPIAKGREWGLFVSRATRDHEPAEFTEPGLFLVRTDGTLHACCVGNAPWARPPLDAVLAGIKTAVERQSPPRGEA